MASDIITKEDLTAAESLINFIDSCPSMFHTAMTLSERLEQAGYVYLPEGWTAQGRMHVHASMPIWSHDNVPYSLKNGHSTTEITLTAPETIAAQNHAVIELRVDGRPTPLLIPLTILG